MDERKAADLQVRVSQIRDKIEAMLSEIPAASTVPRKNLSDALEDLRLAIDHMR